MKTLYIAVRTFFCTVVTVLLFGWFILRIRTLDRRLGVTLPARTEAAGVIFMVAGGILVLLCFAIFAVRGRGTPSPLDPPKKFVTFGPYRYVRNPIHIGQVTLLIGLGLYLRSVAILLFALTWLLFCHLYVLYVEEPSLKKKFGATYEEYCKGVSRWIPRAAPARRHE